MHFQDNPTLPKFRTAESISVAVIYNSPAWKRAMDIGFILMASPVVIPLMAIIAAYIKCVSKGAILFKQERVGYKGNSFTCYKFRSMKPNADVRGHRDHTDRKSTRLNSSHVALSR